MKRILLVILAVVALAGTAQAVLVPDWVPGSVSVRRGYGAVTGSVDSTSFLLRRLTTDATASGIRDTLLPIDVSTWDRSPVLGQGAAKVALGTLFVTFNNATSAGASGDSIGVEWRGSVDGTNWTSIRTVEWFVQTAGSALAAIPIWFDADAFVSGATNDVGQMRYFQPILLGDSAGKQYVSSVTVARYRHLPN